MEVVCDTRYLSGGFSFLFHIFGSYKQYGLIFLRVQIVVRKLGACCKFSSNGLGLTIIKSCCLCLGNEFCLSRQIILQAFRNMLCLLYMDVFLGVMDYANVRYRPHLQSPVEQKGSREDVRKEGTCNLDFEI